MQLTILLRAVDTALRLLPPRMDSDEARAMLLAIALQESGARARVQHGGGPAASYWQFEPAGMRGVLVHPRTQAAAEELLLALDYAPDAWRTGVVLKRSAHSTVARDAYVARDAHSAIAHNDVLAAGLARLNLWWLRGPLPRADQPLVGWRQYLEAWRPGKPAPERWPNAWRRAWEVIDGDGR